MYIIAAALIVRIIWALIIEVAPVSDSNAYDVFAQNLSQHGVYGWKPDQPSAYWAVGTSAIYSIFYSVFGHSYIPIVVFNLVISILFIMLSMKISEYWFGYSVSIATGMILAFWPMQIQFTTILASELIFTTLMLLSLYLLFLRSARFGTYVLIGVVFAITAYTRPIACFSHSYLLFYY